jgi:transcriptional regulator with XRE-family HTH domain
MEGIKMNKTAEIFISRLGKMIKEKGLTQRELASKVGVTEVSMSRYIKGERVPSGPIVVNIAKELGISVDYLVGTSSVKKRQTNADRIRNMSDEELADWIQNMCEFEKDEEPYRSIYNLDTEQEEEIHDSYGDLLNWLQSEAE